MNTLFLNTEELRQLTGFAIKSRQIGQLRKMGIPFRINGCGKPVVTAAAVVAIAEQNIPKSSWQPAILNSTGKSV